MKRITILIILALIIFTSGVSATIVTYEFVKPSYQVNINSIQLEDNGDLIFNYNGYTYIKCSDMCTLLGINFNYDSVNRIANFGIVQEETVYITDTGTKYHNNTCRYLNESKIEINIDEAIKQGYTKCSICH
jgi:hypothetical protein